MRDNALTVEPDTGTTGPAQKAREYSDVTIGGRMNGSASPGELITVRRMKIECGLDRLFVNGSIDYRCWRAGIIFRKKWLACTEQPRVTASYGEQVARSTGGVQDVAASWATARIGIQEAAEVLSQLQWAAVTAVCGQDERCAGRLSVLGAGLEVLAALWDVPVEERKGHEPRPKGRSL